MIRCERCGCEYNSIRDLRDLELGRDIWLICKGCEETLRTELKKEMKFESGNTNEFR